ncbi:DUF6514 family protein [Clostridium senegalense]|uniref:DUF6514 family protein n=1 Tax=Clostridium senegalense TaxID=1465809 RepID=UPI00028868E2|nr:DUF6514 family protein [Clostridium senegalense]
MVIVESLKNVVEIDNVKYEYVYKLLESDYNFKNNEKCNSLKAYGIEVERKDTVKGQVVSNYKDFVRYISPKKEKVTEIIELLNNNIVSPIHLIDVIGEYVDEYVNDFDEAIKNKNLKIAVS